MARMVSAARVKNAHQQQGCRPDRSMRNLTVVGWRLVEIDEGIFLPSNKRDESAALLTDSVSKCWGCCSCRLEANSYH